MSWYFELVSIDFCTRDASSDRWQLFWEGITVITMRQAPWHHAKCQLLGKCGHWRLFTWVLNPTHKKNLFSAATSWFIKGWRRITGDFLNLALLGGEFFQQNPASDPQIYGAIGEQPDLLYSLDLQSSVNTLFALSLPWRNRFWHQFDAKM